jgi:Holliday junction resolvasome RuvABC endonuclease subunit
VIGMAKLFCDPATSFGAAVGKPPDDMASFDIDLKESSIESKSMRLIKLERQLEDLHAAYDITHIGIEESRFLKFADAAFWHGAIVGQILVFAERHGIPVETVAATTLKKFFTGSGSASKTQMMDECEKRTGVRPVSHNEADAIAGLYWMWAQESSALREAAE